jgi:predicted dehydrogenase
LEDCDRIAEVVEKTGVKFMMGYQMRRDPANIAMKELICNTRW